MIEAAPLAVRTPLVATPAVSGKLDEPCRPETAFWPLLVTVRMIGSEEEPRAIRCPAVAALNATTVPAADLAVRTPVVVAAKPVDTDADAVAFLRPVVADVIVSGRLDAPCLPGFAPAVVALNATGSDADPLAVRIPCAVAPKVTAGAEAPAATLLPVVAAPNV